MTDFPSLPTDDESKKIVYVRAVKSSDLPNKVQEQTGGLDHVYAIHAENGAVLALVQDRKQAFIVARQNELSPVSVH